MTTKCLPALFDSPPSISYRQALGGGESFLPQPSDLQFLTFSKRTVDTLSVESIDVGYICNNSLGVWILYTHFVRRSVHGGVLARIIFYLRFIRSIVEILAISFFSFYVCAWLYFYWLSFVSIQCVVCFQSWTVFFFNLRRDSAVFHCTFFVPPLLFCLVFQGCRVKKKKRKITQESAHLSNSPLHRAQLSYVYPPAFSILRIDVELVSLFFHPVFMDRRPLLSLYNIHQLFAYLCAVIRRFLKWLTDHDGFWRAPMSIILLFFLLLLVFYFLLFEVWVFTGWIFCFFYWVTVLQRTAVSYAHDWWRLDDSSFSDDLAKNPFFLCHVFKKYETGLTLFCLAIKGFLYAAVRILDLTNDCALS